MSRQHNSALRWILQLLIIVVLLGLVFFVFYGPTGRNTHHSRSESGNPLTRSHPNTQVQGEKPPFALFTSTAVRKNNSPTIDYTKTQVMKVSKAADQAGVHSELFAPRIGKPNDYLMEIRVFKNKRIVQLLFPNFDIMESMKPIGSEFSPVKVKNIQLSIGPAKWVTYKHGGYHLYLHLHHTYIAVATAKIDKKPEFKKIADSLVPLRKIQ